MVPEAPGRSQQSPVCRGVLRGARRRSEQPCLCLHGGKPFRTLIEYGRVGITGSRRTSTSARSPIRSRLQDSPSTQGTSRRITRTTSQFVWLRADGRRRPVTLDSRKLDTSLPEVAIAYFAALESIKEAPYLSEAIFSAPKAILALEVHAEGRPWLPHRRTRALSLQRSTQAMLSLGGSPRNHAIAARSSKAVTRQASDG